LSRRKEHGGVKLGGERGVRRSGSGFRVCLSRCHKLRMWPAGALEGPEGHRRRDMSWWIMTAYVYTTYLADVSA
jgi:hypothetical protein